MEEEASQIMIYKLWDRFRDFAVDADFWVEFSIGFFKILVFYIASRIIIKLIQRSIHHMISAREKRPLTLHIRRTKTMGKLLNNSISYSVNFITLLLIIDLFGYSLLPLLAGAGVVGLAIGFGAQSLVKDVITGFFILFEDQFAVGDVIQIKGMKGTVEEIGLRLTKIKSEAGEIFMVPNGSIIEVTNFSLSHSVVRINISVMNDSDVSQVVSLMKDLMIKLMEEESDLLKEPEISSVKSFASTETTLRIIAECTSNLNIKLTKIMHHSITEKLDLHDIPYKIEEI